jgi:hypothetical protein
MPIDTHMQICNTRNYVHQEKNKKDSMSAAPALIVGCDIINQQAVTAN